LATAFTTRAQTFADTPDSVRSALSGLSRLSETVAGRDAELRELLARARSVTDVLATRDEEFRKLVADGGLLLAEVSRRRDAIHNLLVGTNTLAEQLSGLVRDNQAQLKPALAQLRAVVAILQRNRTNLEQTIGRLGPFVNAFANVVGNGRWFDSYVAGLVQPFVPAGGR
jgi:phospholipid/cholesterol/gamma-HCH transport system substrate-binding protein